MSRKEVKIPELSLGPIPYYWPREAIFEFYEMISSTPINIVYLGETVCSKRRSMNIGTWREVAELLTRAGKEVVLSTLTLIEAASELSALRKLCEKEQDYTLEANDMAAVQLLSGRCRFVAGPVVNMYNERTLSVLAEAGMLRWTCPAELSKATLTVLHENRPAGTETEVCVFGRHSLAYSARCFTARAHNLPKDDCRFRCIEYPDGILLKTREDEPFLVLNGIQTQSAKTQNLIGAIDDLVDLGVDVLRISPQSNDTDKIIRVFSDRLHGNRDDRDAQDELRTCMISGECNGYWHGKAGMEVVPSLE